MARKSQEINESMLLLPGTWDWSRMLKRFNNQDQRKEKKKEERINQDILKAYIIQVVPSGWLLAYTWSMPHYFILIPIADSGCILDPGQKLSGVIWVLILFMLNQIDIYTGKEK